jgi:hypothetical protein
MIAGMVFTIPYAARPKTLEDPRSSKTMWSHFTRSPLISPLDQKEVKRNVEVMYNTYPNKLSAPNSSGLASSRTQRIVWLCEKDKMILYLLWYDTIPSTPG